MNSNKNYIEIYTDGACSENPGKGGWAAILLYNNHRKELWKAYRKTTNNRMELMAIIEALKAIKPEWRKTVPVVVYSDSQYIVKSINQRYIYNWIIKQFKNVKNPDLWKELINLIHQYGNIKFVWVKGHGDNSLNNQCDKLAVKAYSSDNENDKLNIDEYYEKHSQ